MSPAAKLAPFYAVTLKYGVWEVSRFVDDFPAAMSVLQDELDNEHRPDAPTAVTITRYTS